LSISRAIAALLFALPVQAIAQESASRHVDGIYEVRDIQPDEEPDPGTPCRLDRTYQFCVDGAPLMRFAGAVAGAEATYDRRRGDYVVTVTLTPAGRETFALLTESHVGDIVAVVVDGEVITAPRINEPIGSGTFELQGQQSLAESRQLASRLMAHRRPDPV
jgi:preprotein translocase subunit SecD